MDKIEAARQAKGLIVLEEASAEQVKQAIEQVSTIIATADNEVSFAGQRLVEGHGFALRVNCFDIYACPRGYLLHTYMDNAANWAATGKTLADLLTAVSDRSVARRAHGLLIQKNLVSWHH
jgi:hypothetical protein